MCFALAATAGTDEAQHAVDIKYVIAGSVLGGLVLVVGCCICFIRRKCVGRVSLRRVRSSSHTRSKQRATSSTTSSCTASKISYVIRGRTRVMSAVEETKVDLGLQVAVQVHAMGSTDPDYEMRDDAGCDAHAEYI